MSSSSSAALDQLPKLLIYPDFTQIFRNYPPNSLNIPVPDSSIFESIIIKNQNNQSVPFTYSIPSNSFNIGDEVIVLKSQQQFKGVLSQLTDSHLILIVDSLIVQINNYDQIIKVPQILFPTIFPESSDQLKLTYLINKISWSPSIHAEIQNNLMSITLSGSIKNHTNLPINANCSLVTGKSQTSNYDYSVSARSLMASNSFDSSDNSDLSSTEDATLYPLGLINLSHDKIVHLDSFITDTQKIYLVNINHSSGANVNMAYRLKTPKFLPKSIVRLYQGDIYLGLTNIEETREDETLDIVAGPTSLIRSNVQIISNNQPENSDIYSEHLTVNLVNLSENRSTVILKYFVGTRQLANPTCLGYQRKNGYLEWNIDIDPSKSFTFECDL